MKKTKKQLIREHLLDYLQLMGVETQIKGKLFFCPCKDKHQNPTDKPTANIFPEGSHKLFCFDPNCQSLGDIFNVVRILEPEMADLSDVEIGDYLCEILKIQTDDKTEELLKFYKAQDWALIPLKPKSKIPVEKNWQNSCHKDPEQWKEWLKNGLGFGVLLGEISNVMLVEFDDTKTEEKMKNLMEPTLKQITKRGTHWYYVYDPKFHKTLNKKLRDKGYKMELRTTGAYAVVAPTSVEGETREFDFKPISKINWQLKEFLLKFYDEKQKVEEVKIKDLKDVKLQGLQGCCDDTMIAFGGALRKFLTINDTGKVMHLFNNMLADPMDSYKIQTKIEQLAKYTGQDLHNTEEKVLTHLKKIKEATARDLKDSLKLEKKEVEEALTNLCDKEEIYKIRGVYKVFEKPDWKETFVQEGELINFKMPYFDDYANFRNGDLILICAAPGQGKTHLAMNIVQQLVKQNIKPDYISLESGSRFGTIAMQLGLGEGDFRWASHYRPEDIELDDNRITILDWLLPNDFARVDLIYKRFSEQLAKHGGILIVFGQLKKFVSKHENKVTYEYFAPNQTEQFPSFVCRYLQTGNDYVNGGFETTKIRESKTYKQHVFIPTIYNPETKVLELKKSE